MYKGIFSGVALALVAFIGDAIGIGFAGIVQYRILGGGGGGSGFRGGFC